MVVVADAPLIALPGLALLMVTGARVRPITDELRELELTRIHEALSAAGGQKTRAAALLGMPMRTLHERIKQYELVAP